MAEGASLLRKYTGNRIEGSNPSLSASFRSTNFSWQADSSNKRKLSTEAVSVGGPDIIPQKKN